MQVQSLGWEDPLEKEMVTHFSILAWRIPWTEEPGGLQSMGSRRIGHDLSDLACICKYIYMHVCVCIFEDTQSSYVKTVLLGKDGKTYACGKHDS